MDVITVAWDQKRRKALGGSSLTHLSTVHLLSLPGNREPTTLLQHTCAQTVAHFHIQLTRLRSFCSLKCEHLLKTSLPLKITIMSHVLNVSLMIQYLSIIFKSFILTLFNLENKFSSTEARKVVRVIFWLFQCLTNFVTLHLMVCHLANPLMGKNERLKVKYQLLLMYSSNCNKRLQ